MAALPYIQLYVSDYLADTMHLSTEEHGAYLLLIMNYWQTGKPIPKNRLARISGLNDRWHSVEPSLTEFFKDDGESWIHGRIEGDLKVAREAQEQRARAGKASAEAKKRAKSEEIKREVNGCSTVVDVSLQREANENGSNKIREEQIRTDNKKKAPAPAKAAAISLPDYMKAKKENGEKVIPEDDPVMAYAESVGIPPEFLRICWREFVESYSDGLKKYKDWRTVFRKAVRGNWFKLWWIDDQGAYQLTTTGRQALMAHKENGNG